MEECLPCAFGTTSAPGAKAEEQCRPIPQVCPAGQEAPPGAVSAQQCGCLPGYGGALGVTVVDCRGLAEWRGWTRRGPPNGWVMQLIATMLVSVAVMWLCGEQC